MKAMIWSNQHGMWWRANERGYTSHFDEAGLYDLDRAQAIVANSTCDGQLLRDRIDPITGREYRELDEVIILDGRVLDALGDENYSGDIGSLASAAAELSTHQPHKDLPRLLGKIIRPMTPLGRAFALADALIALVDALGEVAQIRAENEQLRAEIGRLAAPRVSASWICEYRPCDDCSCCSAAGCHMGDRSEFPRSSRTDEVLCPCTCE